MIALENISYKYPRSKAEVIRDFSSSFDKGEIVAVTGPNGCGKTTLTKLMVGILRPCSGRILIDAENTEKMDLFEIGKRVGYVFQNPSRQLFCDTVFNELAYGLKNMGLDAHTVNEKVADGLSRFRLSHHRDDYPGKLSHGEKQRVMLAAILAMGTGHLILDEPTTGLDVLGRHELGELLKTLKADLSVGIVIVSHERGFIERYADREVVI